MAEFGGKGNVRKVVTALESALDATRNLLPTARIRGSTQASPNTPHFSKSTHLEVREAALFDRPTKLEDGERGLANWINMFGAAFLERVPKPTRRKTFCVRRTGCAAHAVENRSLGTRLPATSHRRLENRS